MIYKFALDVKVEGDEHTATTVTTEGADSLVTTEEVFSCIKILKKIRSKPSILNRPLFNPIHGLLAQLIDVAKASPNDLRASTLSKTARIAQRAHKLTEAGRE